MYSPDYYLVVRRGKPCLDQVENAPQITAGVSLSLSASVVSFDNSFLFPLCWLRKDWGFQLCFIP